MSHRPLHIRSPRLILAVAALLALLMLATRGNHIASIGMLPSASWAVFFLTGALLRPVWMFPLLFLFATVIEVGSLSLQRIAAHCLTPAYWTLLPAYFTLWFGGRMYASLHADTLRGHVWLLPALLVSGVVAYQFSGGGYYLLSGAYAEPSIAGHLERMLRYVPERVLTMSSYVIAALALRACLIALMARSPVAARA